MTDELENKIKCFFEYIFHTESKSVCKEEPSEHKCPCCSYPTLPERGSYFICPLCFWEDDGQDEPYCDEVWMGPNSNYSLTEARNNFAEYLTFYRPEDKENFETQKEKYSIKKELIEKYHERAKNKDKKNCEKLKKEIEDLKSQLY